MTGTRSGYNTFQANWVQKRTVITERWGPPTEADADTNDAYIGYRFSGIFGNFRPFVDVAYVNPNNDDQTFVTGGTASLPGSFTFGGYTPGTDAFIDYNIGAAMSFADAWEGYLSFRDRTSDGVQDGYAISLGVRRTF